jgi:hypothetical protein
MKKEQCVCWAQHLPEDIEERNALGHDVAQLQEILAQNFAAKLNLTVSV